MRRLFQDMVSLHELARDYRKEVGVLLIVLF